VTLTIDTEEDDKRQLNLKVEVSEDQVEKAMRSKARELARDLRFSGFRRGKVPYRVVVQRVGRDALRAEALDGMVQDIFVEALQEAEIEPYGQPTLEDMQPEPLVMEFTVPLPPVVTLGEYRELRQEIEPVSITEEAVEEALEQAQIAHQTLEPVERAVQAGDMVTVSGMGVVEAKESDADEEGTAVEEDDLQEQTETASDILFDEESLELLMDSKKFFPGTPFVDNLIGLSAGDETSFGLTFPEDFEEEDLAGRDATFDLMIIDVKNRDLPPLDDELAKLDGDYETLNEMRDGLREQLQEQAQNQAKEKLIESAVDLMLVDTDIQYPPVAVEMEIDEMLQNFKDQITRSGWDFEDYLKIQGSTEESLREDFSDNAEDRLTRRLVLRQFMLDEKLRVDSADVEELVDKRVGHYENEELRKQMSEFYLSGVGFDMISSEVLSNKVYERMVAILSGNAPDLDALAEEEEAIADFEEE